MHPDAVATIFRRNMTALVDARTAREARRRRLRRQPPFAPAPPLDAA